MPSKPSLSLTPEDEIRVLLVGDATEHVDLADRLQREVSAFEVATVADGSEALARLDAGPPVDCVVCDHAPPEIDAIDVLCGVREREPTRPFVVYTNAGSERVAAEAISAGVTAYVPGTPVSDEDDRALLVARIEEAVAEGRANRRSERRSYALETAGEGIGIVDRDGTYTYANPAYAGLYGFEPSELVGEHWERLYPEDEAARFREEILPTLAEDGDWTGRSIGRHRNGTPIPETLSLSSLDDGGHVCIVRDRTDQASREETLADLYDANRRLIAAEDRRAVCEITVQTASRVLDMGLSGVWLYDEKEEILEMTAVTDEADEFFDGEIPDFERGNSLTWEAFESSELRVFDDLTDAADRYNDDTTIRSELIVPLGPHGAMNVGSTSINDFDDTDIYFVKLLAATTEAALSRSKQDELVRKRERAVSGLHDATRRLMKAKTREEIAEIGVNAAKETLGFPLTLVRFYDAERDALMPSATTEDLLETARYATEPRYGGCHTWRVYETGKPQVFGDVHEVTDAENVGDLRSLMILPLGDEGTMSYGSTAVEDFDELDFDLARILAANMQTALERARREHHLAESERKLVSQNEQLEEFASVVTHDLRNPLNVAHGRLDLFKATGDTTHLAPIERAHDRMECIIEDVLLLARHGDVIRETRPVSLETIVQSAWETVRTGDATLEVLDSDEIAADGSRFQQLVENLLRNSVEHGGADVRVTVGTVPNGFYVEDDGPGIPAEDRDRIFDSGFTSRGDGTGLGLAIVSRIADAHGWEIRATEGTEGGARFEITGVSRSTE